MNLRQLEYFIISAESRNITSAAKKLHMAQPPLSRQIGLLEEELGVQLLIRTNRGIELTSAGQHFYNRAKHLIKGLEEVKEEVREADAGLRGHVNLAACFSTIPVITRCMGAFQKRYPLVTFSIKQGSIDEMMEQLRGGTVDFLLLRNCVRDCSDFAYHLLEEDSLKLVVHRDMDPEPEADAVSFSYLRDLPLCILDDIRYPGHGAFITSECKKRGFAPRIICQVYDTSAAMALSMGRVAASFQPESVIAAYNHPDLHVKWVDGLEAPRHPTLIWNPMNHMSQSATHFLSAMTGEPAAL